MTYEGRKKVAIDAMNFYKEKLRNGIYGEFVGNFDIAISALEKQIPKKVIAETEDDREFIDYLCPNCKTTMQQKFKQAKRAIIYPYKHCIECGQALDWRDTE